MGDRSMIETTAEAIRLAIRQEVQDGAKVGMYESVQRTIFTLELNGEIHILGEVKHV